MSLGFLASCNLCLACAAYTIYIHRISVALEALQVEGVDGLVYLLRLQRRHLAARGTHLMDVVAVGLAELVGRGAGQPVPNYYP